MLETPTRPQNTESNRTIESALHTLCDELYNRDKEKRERERERERKNQTWSWSSIVMPLAMVT